MNPEYKLIFYDRRLGQDAILFASRLCPETLAEIVPEYARFYPIAADSFLYAKSEINHSPGKKFIIALLGASATGKDAIMDTILQSAPELVDATLTATTRPRRSDNDRQIFYTREEFMQKEAAGEFVEYVAIGENLYGTQVATIEENIKSPKITLWRGELSGSVTLKKWLTESHPEVTFLTLFVLPDISFNDLAQRIVKERGGKDAWETRIPRALWEIRQAPILADLLLCNPYDPSGQPKKASEAALKYFQKLVAEN